MLLDTPQTQGGGITKAGGKGVDGKSVGGEQWNVKGVVTKKQSKGREARTRLRSARKH